MKKRLIAVVLAALLPAVIMLGYNEFLSRQQRRLEIHRVAAQAARQAASETERILEGVRNMLVAASAIPAVTEGGGPACAEGLKRITERLVSVYTIMVLDPAGRLVCDSLGEPPGADYSDRAYFREALSGPDLAVGGYSVSRPTGAKILPVAMRLERDGAVRGVIVTGIRLEWLERRIEERGLLAGGNVTVTDRDGIILARNPHPQDFVGTGVIDAFMPLVRESQPGTVEMTGRDGVQRIVGYEPPTAAMPLFVGAGIATRDAFAAVDRATLAGIAIIVTGALLAVVLALVVGDRFIVRPLSQIVRTLNRWRGGDESARTGMRGRHGAIGLVGSTIDRMLEELDERRRFAEAAEASRSLMVRELSHRVKNTFSVVQAIARQTFGRRNAAEYDSFSQRLSALAGAYDILVSSQWRTGDMRDVVTRTLKPHHDEGSGQIVLDGEACRLPAQAVLSLSLVIHELATNATKYGALAHPNGRIAVRWRREGEQVHFSWVEDCGTAMEPPQQQGFGSRLIRSAFPGEFAPEASSVFTPTGLAFTLVFRLGNGA